MNRNYRLFLKPAIRFFLIVGFLVFSFIGIGQDSLAMEYLALAKIQLKEKKYLESGSNFKKAKDCFSKSSNWKYWYMTYSGLRKVAFHTNDRSASIDSLKKYYETLPDSAQNELRMCYAARAYNLFDLGLLSESLLEYKNALKILEQINPSDTVRVLSYLRSISNGYRGMGDQISSLKFTNEGIRLARESDNEIQLCKFLYIKGNSLHHDEKNKEAVKAYIYSQDICGESVFTNCKIAESYMYLDKYDLAEKYFDKAKNQLQNEKDNSLEKRVVKYYLSEYLAEINELEESISIKRKLLRNRENYENNRQYIKHLVRLAQAEEKAGRFDDMVNTAHKALKGHYTEMESSNIFSRPNNLNELPDIWIIEALYLKAKYFQSKFQNDNTDVKSNEESSFYYQLLFKYFDQLKSKYDANSSVFRIGQHTRSYYEGIVDFYASQYLATNSSVDYKNGFELSQKANSYVLKNAISERQALEISGISQDSIDLFFQLVQSASNDQNAEDIFKLEKLKAELGKRVSYFNDEKSNDVISLEKIQESLNEGELLLKYFYVNENLLVYRITKKERSVEKIILPENFKALIDKHQFLIAKSETWNESEYQSLSYEIFNLVLANSLSFVKKGNIEHIIIIPDGPLKRISFSSLIQNDVSDFIRPEDYLINDYEISYLYYASQIAHVKDKSSSSKDRFMSFGIEYEDKFLAEVVSNYWLQIGQEESPRSLSLSKLNFADDEAKNIAQIIGGESLTNQEVTKTTVQKMIKKYRMLHFSAHAFVDMDNYLNSFLVLNKDDSEEYKLSYKDILNMSLNSDFVVLSACQTANGQDYSGESLMSLSRAFAQSGCKSTMSSYWNASDKSTMDIMDLFYNQLVEGNSKSLALRNSQLEYLKNDNISVPSTRSPFYWSSWAIYGDNSEIQKDDSWSNIRSQPACIKLLIISGLCLLSFLFFKKMKKSIFAH